MGFSLKNLGSRIWDQVNMWDDGRTWQNRTPVQRPQNNKPFQAPYKAPVDTRSGRSKRWDQINPFDGGRTSEQATPTTTSSVVGQFGKTLDAASQGWWRGVGGVQSDVSGFVDLVTPGTGTSRYTKAANKLNEDTDQRVIDRDLSRQVYFGGQLSANAAAFKTPSALLGKAGLVDDAASLVNKGGPVVKWATKPSTILDITADASQGAGFRAAREQDVSPTTVATDVAASTLFGGAVSGAGAGFRKIVGMAEDGIPPVYADTKPYTDQVIDAYAETLSKGDKANIDKFRKEAVKQLEAGKADEAFQPFYDESIKAPKVNTVTNNRVQDKGASSVGDTLDIERFKQRAQGETPQVDINEKVAQMSDEDFTNQMMQDLGISKATAQRIVAENNKPAIVNNLYRNKDFVKNAKSPSAYAYKIMTDARAKGTAAMNQNMPPTTQTVNGDPNFTVVDGSGKTNGFPDKEILQPSKTSGPEVPKVTQDKPKVELKTAQAADGQTINTATGEIIPEAPKQDFFERVKTLPDVRDVNRQQADEIIGEMSQRVRDRGAVIEQSLAQKGDSWENFSRAIQEANRSGIEPSKEYADLYNKHIRPIFDELRTASNKEDIGDVGPWYLPQYPKDMDLDQINVGGTLVSDLDNQVFGSAIQRTDALSIDEMVHSPEVMTRYATQAMAERYRRAVDVDKLIQRSIDDGAEMTVDEAHKALDLQDSLSNEIKDTVDNGGIFSTDIEKMDITKKVNDLGQAKKRPQYEITDSLSRANRLTSSSDEIYNSIYLPDGSSMGEASGFNRYTSAEGMAYSMNEELGDGDIVEYLTNQYADVNIDAQAKSKIINATERALNSIDTEKFTPEEVLNARHYYFTRAERNIAREQLVEFLEGHTIRDKQLLKNLNQDSIRMLTTDHVNQSIASNLVNGFTGTVYTGALGWNFLSGLQNVLENKRAYSIFTAKEAATATQQALGDSDIAYRYGIHESKVSDALEQRGKKGKTALWKPMGWFGRSETFKDSVLLHGFENKYMAKKLEGTELTRAVLKDFNKYAIKYGQAGSLGFNKSKTGRLWGQFLQFTVKDLKLQWDMGKKAFGGAGVDAATKRDAQKYLLKLNAQNVAIYLVLNAAIGSSWEYVWGLQNPVQGYDKEGAGMDEKVVRRLPGGPAVDMAKDLYLSIREEQRLAQQEERPTVTSNIINNSIKKDLGLLVPGGNQIFNKTGGFITDQQRGYNENSTGKARFDASEDNINKLRGIVFGRYSTDKAREYFGSSGLAGDLPGRGGEQKYPVGDKFQEKIEKSKGTTWNERSVAFLTGDPVPQDKKPDKKEISRLIGESRAKQDRKTEFFTKNPELEGVYKDMVKTTYNPTTKKNESNVLSPEKWAKVSSDKSLTLYKYLKTEQEKNNKEFGFGIDPIYQITDEGHIKEVLALRSRPTGDDIEREEILRATTDWYKKFEDAERSYYEKMDFKEDPESDFSNSERKQKWLDVKHPDQPEVITKYYKLKETNPDAAKEMFKTTGLSQAFDDYRAARLVEINAKRELEGFPPIDESTFNNVTFGYEDDERKVYNTLAYGKGYGGYSRRSGGGGGGAKEQYESPSKYRVSISTSTPKSGKAKAAPKVAGSAKKSNISKPRVTIKKSKV